MKTCDIRLVSLQNKSAQSEVRYGRRDTQEKWENIFLLKLQFKRGHMLLRPYSNYMTEAVVRGHR